MGSVVPFKEQPILDVDAAKLSRTRPQQLRLTEAKIPAIPVPDKAARYIYDTEVPGLALRITATGVRTFVLVKKIAGRTERITFGRWPGLRLADARRTASADIGAIAAGRNPAAERRAFKTRAETCRDFWPQYLSHIKRKNRTWEQDARRWETDVASRLGQKALRDVTIADCQAIVDKIGAEHPIKANRIVALLGAFFAHAVRYGRLDRNPARGLSRYPETVRERFLSAAEIQKFLAACDAAPQPWGDLFALLLWTGARKSAVMAMRWRDLDLATRVWHIPARNSKNKQAAAVPLIEAAVGILQRRRQTLGSSDWVFPSIGRTGHIAHAAKAWGALMSAAQLPELRPHDLRRTIGSWLAASGANSFLIQRALTHKSPASAKPYAHLDVEAVREALTAVTNSMGACSADRH